MSIHRRDFLKFTGAAAAAAGMPIAFLDAQDLAGRNDGRASSQEHDAQAGAAQNEETVFHTQRMHPDYQSNNDGVEYFFLGNGMITAALQTSQTAAGGTNYGLLVMSPEHFGRKASTMLYHPEHGLRKTLLNVVVDGNVHLPPASPAAELEAKRKAEEAKHESEDSKKPGILSGDAGALVPSLAPSDSTAKANELPEEEDDEWEERPGAPIEPFYSRVWEVKWKYPDSIPTVAAEWRAGACAVNEEFFCPIGEPALVRTVTITNDSKSAAAASAFIALDPNLMLFDEFQSDPALKTLTVKGFAELRLFSSDAARTEGRQLHFEFGTLDPGASVTVTMVLTLNRKREEFEKKSLPALKKETSAYWSAAASVTTNDESYNHLFHTSQTSLRAATARSGKIDESVWEYNRESVRDESMAAAAASMMGRSDMADAILRRILANAVDPQGRIVTAGSAQTAELDQNGSLLYSLWQHWMWSGSDAVIRTQWEKVKHVADFVLRPEFRDPATGLVKSSREFWGRDASLEVKEGYELMDQMWNVIGLANAAEMAEMMNKPADARRWREASDLMKQSFLTHPNFSLVNENRFAKRRLIDGTVQMTLEPRDRSVVPAGMPLNVEKISYIDPDSSSVLPIVYGLANPHSSLAANTLHSIETLRNQRWRSGGYGRFHVTSEPDSPGAWPLATMFAARAALEIGDNAAIMRALAWMRTIQGGSAGAWLEFYGDRPVPPLPPVGVRIWTWAEVVMFFIHGLLGVRPDRNELVIHPKLFWGVDSIDARIPVRGMTVDLKVRRSDTSKYALVNGVKTAMKDGAVGIHYTKGECAVELFI